MKETMKSLEAEITTLKASIEEKNQQIYTLTKGVNDLSRPSTPPNSLTPRSYDSVSEVMEEHMIQPSMAAQALASPRRSRVTDMQDGQSLSPKTKESISELKHQLRTAHAGWLIFILF